MQLCFFVQNDSSTLKVLKMQFVFDSAMIRNIMAKKQSSLSWKVGLKSGVGFLILFVLTDAILLRLDLQKRTIYKFSFSTFYKFVKHIPTKYQKIGSMFFI